MKNLILPIALSIFLFVSCSKDDDDSTNTSSSSSTTSTATAGTPAASAKFAGIIDFKNLDNYEAQSIPSYINKDNTNGNTISNKGATLGRILFYDKELSIDKSISCGSCHQQAHAFSDAQLQSDGVNNGLTGRHSMRLINSRFSTESKFFWNERASSLEVQTTMPIQDHAEMGFSGQSGNPDLNDLLVRLQAIDYYKELFNMVYGDSTVSESRIQMALAQFIRSIQSFDSKFDQGLAQTANINQNFSNYSTEENQGKTLFINPPQQGGAGCQGCHAAPEFDIDPNTMNNGIIGTIGSSLNDLTNTRAPSLRDVVNQNGTSNGPFMHDGSLTTLEAVIDHYNLITIDPANNNLDRRLTTPPPGPPQGQNLQLTQAEKDALVAFLKTLSGSVVYTDSKWSDPF